MAEMAIDTHDFVKRLTAAGMPESQAEAVTTMLTTVREFDIGLLATKADIGLLATKAELAVTAADVGVLKADNAFLKTEVASIRTDIANTRADLLKWMSGLVMTGVLLNAVTVIGGMVALIKALGH